EESLEREDTPGCLDPLVVDRSAHGRDMHSHLVSDLLHLEWLDVLGPLVEKLFLVLDDCACHAQDGVAALLNGLDQPARRLDLALDEFTSLGIFRAIAQDALVVAADIELRHMLV